MIWKNLIIIIFVPPILRDLKEEKIKLSLFLASLNCRNRELSREIKTYFKKSLKEEMRQTQNYIADTLNDLSENQDSLFSKQEAKPGLNPDHASLFEVIYKW